MASTFSMIVVGILAVLILGAVGAPTAVNGVGTALNQLLPNSPYRVFNDLMKQSAVFVPYQVTYSWIAGRKWGYNLSLGADLYPTTLDAHIYAETDILFFAGIDESLVNTTFEVRFDGNGTIGCYQNGTFNISVTTGQTGTFQLGNLTKLQVFIYFTDPTDLVRNIRIVPTGVTATFTTNFLSYVGVLEIFRFCFWQAESPRRLSLPITPLEWAARITPTSATQVSAAGIAHEHILEFEQVTGKVGWYCIPEAANDDYITNMALLYNSTRNTSKLMYLEYANTYSIMNDVPDNVTTPRFELWMTNYGMGNRDNVMFVVSYTDIQYFINAMGMQKERFINWTYIDAIGFEAYFGDLSAGRHFNLSDTDLKKVIIDAELSRQAFYVRARQFILQKNLTMVCYSGGPYIKVPQFGAQFGYDFLKYQTPANLVLKNKEVALAAQLEALNRDPWMAELTLDWIRRLKNFGVSTVMFYQFVEAWTDSRFGVPLLRALNGTSTPVYDAVKEYIVSNRVSTFPLTVAPPADDFVCTPSCVWGDCISNICVCYVGYSGPACDVSSPDPQQQQKIGMNLAGIADYSTEIPFVDAMKTSRDWTVNLVGGGWGSGQARYAEIPQDSDGYPTSLPDGLTVLALISRDLISHYDNGTYILLYDGDGSMTFGMDDVPNVTRGVGRIELNVVPTTNMNNGIMITIVRTNPSNYIRNMRLIRPGFENIYNRVVFHPMFLSKIQPYGTLRFMEWGATNVQTNEEWVDRTQVSFRTFSINGVPFEYMIKLCNIMGKNMWVNVPHLASDDFIQKLATLIKTTLRPDLKVYVEYSNQVWGNLFSGGQYAQLQGLAYSLSADPTEARFCFLGVMTQTISSIFRPIFNDTPSQLQVVVSTQAVNADTTRRILACQDTYQYVDGVAVAPYFGANLTNTTTMDQLFDTLLPAQLATINTTLAQHLAFANQYNLKLLCYESGQGLLGGNPTQVAIQIAAQKQPRMASAYVTYLNILFNNSITLASHFSNVGKDSRYGSWGLFQYVDVRWNASQKWLGISSYFTQQNITVHNLTFANCSKNCSGNGICHYGQCFCYSDYTGDNCHLQRFIDFIECGYKCNFHGTCGVGSILGNVRNFVCTCDAGYTGAHCGIAICTGNCNYQGICSAAENCTCFEGRKGTKCEIDCGCQGHGRCSTTNNTCVCDNGYFWNTTSLQCEFQCQGQPSANCYAPNQLNCNPLCVNGDCRNGQCSCWPGFKGSTCEDATPTNFPNENLGINLGGLAYWSTQYIHRNYFYQSSAWIPQYYPGYYNSTLAYTWNTSENIAMRSDGYPTSLNASQKVAKLVLRDLKLKYPKSDTNRYLLLFEGEGLIDIGFDATILNYRPGRILFKVVPTTVRDNGVYVQLLKTNPSNPIHNIRIILESDEYLVQEVITDSFREFIKQFSTIRLMDLSSTNANPNINWSDNVSPVQDTQAGEKGVCPDLLVDLLKRTGRNGWINIPHLATDDYVTQYATLLFNKLSPHQLIYVEYSNQVWNSFFAQGKYAIAQATALGLSNPHVFYGTRCLQIFTIFSTVFGANRTTSQLRFVVSGQAVNVWVMRQAMSVPGLATMANIIAIAPYFDCSNIGNSTNSAYYSIGSVDDIISRCDSTLSTMDSAITPYQQLAANLSLNFSCYEAGTSISEQQPIYSGIDTPGLTDKLIAANRDPRMSTIYRLVLGRMESLGLIKNSPTMLFSSIGLPSKYGSWGVLDYSDQVYENPTHPKFQAILDYNGRGGCNAFLYQFKCVTNCPNNTAPKMVNGSINCIDCPSDCSGSAVRFTITVKIKLRALSIVLKPSQPISPNFKPQFQLILVPLNSKRLMADGQIVIPVQTTDVSSSGIAISAVIPSDIDTNIYGGLQLQFTGLANSATDGGALLADAKLSINLADVQSQQAQANKISVLGQVISVLFIVLLAVFVGYEQFQKFMGVLLLLQTIYLIGYGLNPTTLDSLEVLAGFSFGMLSFVPSIFAVPSDYIEATTQAILKYGVDGSLIRNAGYSLTLLLMFAAALSLYLLISYVHKRYYEDSKLWRPELLKNIGLICYLLVALNILVFSFFEFRFWFISTYRDLFLSGFIVAILAVALTVGLTILAGFKDRNLLVLQLQLIGSALVLAFGLSNYMVALLAVWVGAAVGKLILNWQKTNYDKLLVIAETLLAILAIAGCIFGKESQMITIASISAALGSLFILMIYDLIFRTIRRAAQIEPSPDSKMEPDFINEDSQLKDSTDFNRNIRNKKSRDSSGLRDSDLMIKDVRSEDITVNNAPREV